MAELKTKKTEASVDDFIAAIEDDQRRKDCKAVMAIMKRVTKSSPKMWGTNIVGYGSYHYKYASGQEGDWPLTGFSPRKQNLTLYIMAGFDDYPELMAKLGKYKTGKSCLYLKRLSDVDPAVLEKLVAASVKDMKEHYGPK
ncbi:MAG: DUF1801 domain-containing protein [Acidobacteria bacterium]|jgi:hypothetical protein|nr:DUF1801 domain-containing protein [Acidobacteriota bacterium]